MRVIPFIVELVFVVYGVLLVNSSKYAVLQTYKSLGLFILMN